MPRVESLDLIFSETLGGFGVCVTHRCPAGCAGDYRLTTMKCNKANVLVTVSVLFDSLICSPDSSSFLSYHKQLKLLLIHWLWQLAGLWSWNVSSVRITGHEDSCCTHFDLCVLMVSLTDCESRDFLSDLIQEIKFHNSAWKNSLEGKNEWINLQLAYSWMFSDVLPSLSENTKLMETLKRFRWNPDKFSHLYPQG